MYTAFGSATDYSFSIPQYEIYDIPLSEGTFKTIHIDLKFKHIRVSERRNMEFPLCLILLQCNEKKTYWLDLYSFLLFFKRVISDNVRDLSQNITLKALINNAEHKNIIF
jgi:hypothetical protein